MERPTKLLIYFLIFTVVYSIILSVSLEVVAQTKQVSSSSNSQEENYNGGTVISSPYLGLRSHFEGMDLLINLPSINEDLRLLKQKQIFEKKIREHGLPMPKGTLIDLSGMVETTVFHVKTSGVSSSSDVNVTNAELTVLGQVGRWTQGFLSFAYDPDSNVDGIPARRTSQSRVFLNKGFLTVGNLNESPFYFSTGQMFVPFGRYSTHLVSSALTKNIGRVKARTIVLGFSPKPGHIHAQAYYFKGDALAAGKDQWGINSGIDFDQTFLGKGEFGVGFISHIGESDGLQNKAYLNYSPYWNRPVHGLATFWKGRINRFSYGIEHVTALKRFSSDVLTYQRKGARPAATNVEIGYDFARISGSPVHLGLTWAQTIESLGLNIAQKRYGVSIATGLWKETLAALEYLYERDYDRSTVSLRPSKTISGTQSTIVGTDNESTKFSAYFALFF